MTGNVLGSRNQTDSSFKVSAAYVRLLSLCANTGYILTFSDIVRLYDIVNITFKNRYYSKLVVNQLKLFIHQVNYRSIELSAPEKYR